MQAGRLPGFRPLHDRVLAVAGPGGAIRERIPDQGRMDRQPGVARVGVGFFSGPGLAGSGSNQRHAGQRQPSHAGVGPRLLRCGASERSDDRRGKAVDPCFRRGLAGVRGVSADWDKSPALAKRQVATVVDAVDAVYRHQSRKAWKTSRLSRSPRLSRSDRRSQWKTSRLDGTYPPPNQRPAPGIRPKCDRAAPTQHVR